MTTESYQTIEAIDIPSIAIGRLIFNSNLSDVFEAYSELSSTPLAVKIAKPGLVPRVALQTEAEVTPSITSNHVLPLLSYGTIRQPGVHWNGLTYTVSPLVSGGTLRDYEATDRSSVKTALAIAQDAARGIRDLHSRGYIHRDVTAGNIFIDKNAKGFIGDLGFVERADYLRSLAGTSQFQGRLFGTLGFMPPEQMTGDLITTRSDVFGLAVAAIKAMTGRFPWKNIHDDSGKVTLPLADVFKIIVHERPDQRLPRFIPLDCREVLYECLNPYQHRRPSIDEFIEMPSERSSFIHNIGHRALSSQTRQLPLAH